VDGPEKDRGVGVFFRCSCVKIINRSHSVPSGVNIMDRSRSHLVPKGKRRVGF